MIEIRPEHPVYSLDGAIKRHLFQPYMVEEIFSVNYSLRRATYVGMDGRGGMGRQGQRVALAKRIRLQKARDTAAAGGVGLQNIHGAGRQHAAKIPGVISVLARRDIHARRPGIANQPQPVQVVGRNRFFKPCDAHLSEAMGLGKSLLPGVGSIGIYEKLCLRSDRLLNRRDAF